MGSTRLPFGLENCVCDGADIGEAVGLAACSRVFAECNPPLVGFSAGGEVEAVQRACDSLSKDSCMSSAGGFAQQNGPCMDIVRNGNINNGQGGRCDAQTARNILLQSITSSCAPLCPTCVPF